MDKSYIRAVIDRIVAAEAQEILSEFPVLALVGPRQIGKTSLAQELMKSAQDAIYLDLESPYDLARLENAEQFFRDNEHQLIVLDEVQRDLRLFPILRSVVDANRKPGRFIVLGSASPDIIRDASETLAGRIAYLELSGLNVMEVQDASALWTYGAYPNVYLKPNSAARWYENYVRTYIERDLPMLGLSASPTVTRKLWTMLAHYHGQLLDYTELSKSLEVSSKTVKSYLSFLEGAFLIRTLQPYSYNIKKRLVKSPKVYVRDSGILHHLLGLNGMNALMGHPKLGASWEGFVIEQIAQFIKPGWNLHFYKSHQGAELDLILEHGLRVKAAIEIKFGDRPTLSKGNLEAAKDVRNAKKFIITQHSDEWTTKDGFLVCGLPVFVRKHLPSL